MKIKSLRLENIGLYTNELIEFETVGKTTVIVWGNNGAGKTTLLNSIKIALFGEAAFSFGYEDYCEFITSSMISSRISDSETKKAKIEIEIEIKENNELKIYKIERGWDISDKFEEQIRINSGTYSLNFLEKEEFLNRLKIQLPPSLLDVIVFDGENAINILTTDEMPRLIKNIIFAIFGMDVYSNLIKDLNFYLKNMKNTEDSALDQMKLIDLENEYKSDFNNKERIRIIIEELEKKKKATLNTLTQYTKKISEKTGVEFENILNFKNSLAEMEDNRKNLMEEVKYVTEEVIPFKMLHNKIKKLLEQAEIEKPYLMLNNLDILKNYFIDDVVALKHIIEIEKRINKNNDIKLILNLNDFELNKIEKLEEQLSRFSYEKLMTYFDKKNQTFMELKGRISQIEKLNDDESLIMIDKVNDLYADAYNIQNQLIQVKKEYIELQEKLNCSKKEYDSFRKVLLTEKKKSNSYLNVLEYKDVLEEFVKENIEDICKELNDSISSELKRIKFRNNSIKTVIINPKTFTINLFENDDKIIPSKLFSAGEKQILLGLIIKESLRLSKIENFFLFDTPVGRLDVKNRDIFTKEVILKISEQAMIFATDSDYSKEDYESIKNDITSEMVLARNEYDQIVLRKGSIYGGE